MFEVLSTEVLEDVIENPLDIEITLSLLQACQKFGSPLTRLIYEKTNLFGLFLKSSPKMNNYINFLYTLVKCNLISSYDNFSIFYKFILEFENLNYKKLVANDSDSYFKLLYVLSNFALRSMKFNPIYNVVIHDLPNFLSKIDYLSKDNLKIIFHSLAVVELMMKHKLCTTDFTEIFTEELINSLVCYYQLKYGNEIEDDVENDKIMLSENIEKELNISIVESNLFQYKILFYKDVEIPLITVDSQKSKNLDSEGKLDSENYILYHHLKSFTNFEPLIIDLPKINSLSQLDNLICDFKNNRKHFFNKCLN